MGETPKDYQQRKCNTQDCKYCPYFILNMTKPACAHPGGYYLDCAIIVASGNYFAPDK